MSQYIISPVTQYDSDKQLWETYIGKDNTNKSLIVSVWGKTKEDSIYKAAILINLFSWVDFDNHS